MSAGPGWYPDPAGQPALLRYWDGATWSSATASRLGPPPPTAPRPQSPEPQSPEPQSRKPQSREPQSPGSAPSNRRTYGWLIALVAVVVVVVVVAVLVVQRIGTEVLGPGLGNGQSSADVCPPAQTASPDAQPNDGRVYGGRLSYPRLGAPWSAPRPEYDVAFGRQVLMQSVEIERSAGQSWLAAVLVGELVAGDGFFSPEDGAAIVVRCVSGTFYGNSEVTRDDQVNRALKVDGRDAWVIESQLGFDVAGIQAKRELLIVVIVAVGDGTAGLFYASIPENAPQLVKPARDALAALQVG